MKGGCFFVPGLFPYATLKLLKKNNPLPLKLLFLLLIVIVSVFTPLAINIEKTPPNSYYPFAEGFLPDFYQYNSWINDGINGHILLTSRYTQALQKPSLIHPLFPLAGWISRPLHLSSFTVFLLLRVSSLIFFLIVINALIDRFFVSSRSRWIAAIMIITSTSFWTMEQGAAFSHIREPVEWINTFSAISKFNLPPHHLFALGFLILSMLLLTRSPITHRSIIKATICAVLAGFLNPPILAIFLLFWAFTASTIFVTNRFRLTRHLAGIGCYLLIGGTVFGYHYTLFQSVLPWSQMYTLMRAFHPPVTFSSYFQALGPTLVLSLFALSKKLIKNPLPLFLTVWAYLPLALFPFLGHPIPINASRLFQSYQYIPVSILATQGLINLAYIIRSFIPLRFSTTFLAIVLIVYSIPPAIKTIKATVDEIQPRFYNAYVPVAAVHAFNFLNEKSARGSVVLSGEYVSQMIPAFTHNRTILGRDDVAPDYYQKQKKAYAFLDGKLPSDEALQFLKRYTISYVLFGVDTRPYETIEILRTYSFMKEVLREENVSIVHIIED